MGDGNVNHVESQLHLKSLFLRKEENDLKDAASETVRGQKKV